MWVAFVFLAFLVLALLLPSLWALKPVWLAANRPRLTNCPVQDRLAAIRLDPWFAVRMRARGENRRRVKECEFWPEFAGCEQRCVRQFVKR